MQKDYFERLQKYDFANADIVGAHNLYPYTLDRTLLYGYTCDRSTFHVYLKDSIVYVVVYETEYSRGTPVPKNMRQIEVRTNRDYVPDKRLYPERCDYDFCVLLKERGIDLPFTTYNDQVDLNKDYFGFTLKDV